MEQFNVVRGFDGLLERMLGRGDPAHETVAAGEASKGMNESRTELIKEIRLGHEVVRFAVFSSDTKSGETGKPLYPPSITAFSGTPGEYFHVKRFELEAEPRSEQERERKAKAIADFTEIEKLFTEYEEVSE